jgi:hypothetical protein
MRETVLEIGNIVWTARRSANRGNGAVGHPRARVPAPRTPVTTREAPRAAKSERRRQELCPAAKIPRDVTVMVTSISRGKRGTCTQGTSTCFYLLQRKHKKSFAMYINVSKYENLYRSNELLGFITLAMLLSLQRIHIKRIIIVLPGVGKHFVGNGHFRSCNSFM